jgi:acyl-CoA synthetase (AMP-forming)/AMP-acid ligase II
VRVHDFLDFHAEKSSDAEFAVCSGKRIAYGEAQDQSNRVAHALIDAGANQGDRIAILQKNSIETVLLYHGAFKAGVVPAPINYRLLPADWLRICQDMQPKLFFCDAEFVPKVDEIRSQLKSVQSFIMTSELPLPGWAAFRAWSGAHAPQPPNVSVGEEDALLLYTSGTTGPPKGALLTHCAVTSNIAQLKTVATFRPADRFLLVLPLCHAAGIVAMLHTISCGACLVIQQDFDPDVFVSTLDEQDVTVTMMVPTMIRKCLDEVANLANRSFEKLKLVIYGASPIREETVKQMTDVFGCDLAQRYGTTETLSLTWLTPADHRLALQRKPELLRSAGHPLPGTQIQIVDENGKTLPNGKRGEIVVRGPQVMRGYWKSVAAMDDNHQPEDWIHTGDVGFVDSDGYIYICDRMNDVIISGGENIHPREIESVLLGHPNVDDVAVIGVPDRRWGERVKAIVALRNKANCSAEQLIEYCRGHLAGYKVPDSVDFVDRLPRNQSGKTSKAELREAYWRDHDRWI